MRWTFRRRRTTRSAWANAASTSPVPMRTRADRLSPSSAWTSGAPGSRAIAASVTTGAARSPPRPARGILRGVAAAGDDEGERLAGEAGLVDGQQVLRLRTHQGIGDGAQRRAGQLPAFAGHRAQALARRGAGPRVDDAGQRSRRRQVDGADAGMGVRAAHEGQVERILQRDVVDVAPGRRWSRRRSSLRRTRAPMWPRSQRRHGPRSRRLLPSASPSVGSRRPPLEEDIIPRRGPAGESRGHSPRAHR